MEMLFTTSSLFVTAPHVTTASTPSSKTRRLSSYDLVNKSPMLNPCETLWSKIKAYVKSAIQIPVTNDPGVVEQRIVYERMSKTSWMKQ